MEQIGIEAVLAKFNDTIDGETSALKTYGIRFLSKAGDNPELNARKYTKGFRQSTNGQDKRGRSYYNLQRNGVLLIEDLSAEHPKSIKTAMIYAFRDNGSNKWLKVFH